MTQESTRLELIHHHKARHALTRERYTDPAVYRANLG